MKKHMIDLHIFKWGRNVIPMNEVLWANLICQLVDASEQERAEYCNFAYSKLNADFKSQGKIKLSFNRDLTLEVEKEAEKEYYSKNQIIDMILVSHKIRSQIYERTFLYTKEEGKEDFRSKTKDLDRYLFPLMGMMLSENHHGFRVIYKDIREWQIVRGDLKYLTTRFSALTPDSSHRDNGIGKGISEGRSCIASRLAIWEQNEQDSLVRAEKLRRLGPDDEWYFPAQ